jgi:[ribosomal protein S5]-alanine N-acetyltransferase
METARFVLRNLENSDEEGIFALRSDDEINKYLGRAKAQSIEDARKFIHTIQDNVLQKATFYWVICDKTNQAFLGTICLWNIDFDLKKAELGYELLPSFHGKKIIQEVLPVIIKCGFEQLKLNHIEARLDKNNLKSVAILEKFNFKNLALKDNEKEFDDEILYCLFQN